MVRLCDEKGRRVYRKKAIGDKSAVEEDKRKAKKKIHGLYTILNVFILGYNLTK